MPSRSCSLPARTTSPLLARDARTPSPLVLMTEPAGASTIAQPEGALASIFSDERPVILFDGSCNLCNSAVNFILDWDLPNDMRGTFRFASMESPLGRALLERAGRSPDDTSAVVLSCKDTSYAKSDAVLRIGASLGRGTSFAPLFASACTLALALPTPARDALCNIVSEYRTLLGHGDSCRVSDERFDARFLSDLYDCGLDADDPVFNTALPAF
mmetsp:Transcript_5941/g.15209  ORF Transcript_5941/g.15209 Transcript_5941/m.15209 type:complete len:215 (+) Transcript_5941:1-645(+)